jgi:LysR family nitrogen assimilation transcriptional regulator
MNLKKLEAFLLVTELGSLSRAAKVAGTTQSFISRQITQLEAEWGDKLFERNGRGVVLSSFGQRLHPEIKLLLEQVSRVEGAVRDNAGVPAGDVRVGIVPSMARRLSPLLFADVQDRAPAVRLHIVEAFTGSLEEQLTAGQLDLAVMNRYNGMSRHGEDILGYVDTMLIGKPGSPCLADEQVRFRDLDNLPLVLPPVPNGLRTFLDQQAKQQGIRINVKVEVNTLPAMTNIAASGDAFSFLPLLAVNEETAMGRLAVSQIIDPDIRRTISLGLTKHHPLSKAARLVASRARELATSLLSAQQNYRRVDIL